MIRISGKRINEEYLRQDFFPQLHLLSQLSSVYDLNLRQCSLPETATKVQIISVATKYFSIY